MRLSSSRSVRPVPLDVRLLAVEDSQRSAEQYDAMAEAYATDNLDSSFNAHYERPATQMLLGDVSGKRILEVGCGAGPLTEWLVGHGAAVTAMDVSPVMARLARARLSDRARILVGDLAEPLDFAPDASFDLVVASLVVHYLRDWTGPLRESPPGAHARRRSGLLHPPSDYGRPPARSR